MKSTMRILAVVLAASVCCWLPVGAHAAVDPDLFTYDNSIVIDLTAPDGAAFEPADFPGADGAQALIAQKLPAGEKYNYRVILTLQHEGDKAVEAAVQAALLREDVTAAGRNVFAEGYAARASYLKLNQTELTLTVGRSAELTIEELRLVPNNQVPAGVDVTIDPTVIPAEAVPAYMAACGAVEYYPVGDGEYVQVVAKRALDGRLNNVRNTVSPNGHYLVLMGDGMERPPVCVSVVDQMAGRPGLVSAQLYKESLLSGAIPQEWWTVDGEGVVSLTLTGGEEGTVFSLTPLGQTATVTALRPGKAVIRVERMDSNATATVTCPVTVVEDTSDPDPALAAGDVNGDAAVDARDALLALQAAVEKTTLTDRQIAAADLDANGLVNAVDALIILQRAVASPASPTA